MTDKKLERMLSAKTETTARKNIAVVMSPDITRNAARLRKRREDMRQTALCILSAVVFIAAAVVLGVIVKNAPQPQAVLRTAALTALGCMGIFLLCAPVLAWSADEEQRNES